LFTKHYLFKDVSDLFLNYFRTSDGSNEYIVKTRVQNESVQSASPAPLANADDFMGSEEESGGPETPLDDEALSSRIEIKNNLDNFANMTTALPLK
jgi:hypothetical protein